MRFVFLALILCVSAYADSSHWQYSSKMIAHPIRAEGTNRVNLAPLFAWIRTDGNQRSPMPQWKALKMRVVNVTDTGIIGYPYSWNRDFDKRESDGAAILRNWPTKGVAEGDSLEIVALEAGTEKVNGRTLRKYDGGLPYATKPKAQSSSPSSSSASASK